MITLESLISTVCLDVLNVVLVDYFIASFYKKKSINKFYEITIYLICILFDLIFLDKRAQFNMNVIIILMVSFKYIIKIQDKIIFLLTIVIIDWICNFASYYLFAFIFNSNSLMIGILPNDILTILHLIIHKYLVYIIAQFILYKKNKISKINLRIFKYISFGVSIFYGLTITIFYKELLFYHVKVGRIFIFTLVLYNTVLVIFNYYQNMHIRTVNKLETLKQNRSYQGKYWKDYYENYAAIRKTKHDMLNGYIGLYGLVKEERYDELKLYLEASIKNLKEMESVHYFGNPLIDAIVSKKISDAKERGIEVVFHCGVISIGDIDEEDLGILLANALDNAIESTVKSSYDKIDVYVSTMNCFLKIDVINYVDDITGVSFKNSSKVFDKENHGIGIKSMKDTAKKYNGSLQYDKKDNEVILSVIMNIN